jgi:hypothetical protein
MTSLLRLKYGFSFYKDVWEMFLEKLLRQRKGLLTQLMLAGYNAFKSKTMWNMLIVFFLTTKFSQEQVFRYCYWSKQSACASGAT